MALPQQLKSARLAGGDNANTIDTVIGSFESALADIFGFTIDSDITVSPFSLNNSGQITKQLVLQRAAGPVGWRMRDTTTGTEVRIAVSGANFVIDENTSVDPDPETNPAWTNRFSMVISTGALTAALATASRMGLVPQGSGNATDFLDGTLSWSVPGASTPPSCRLTHSSNQSCASGSTVTLTFDTETFDTDTMHSTVTNPSRITCVTAGKYVVIGQASFASNATGNRTIQIIKNGVTLQARTVQPTAASANTSIQVCTVVEMAVGDYVQLQVIQTSGSTINCLTAATYSPVFGAFKIA